MDRAIHPDGRAASSCSGLSNIYTGDNIIGNACVAGAGLYIDADSDIISNSYADADANSNPYAYADADAIRNSYAYTDANARANHLCDAL